MSSELDLVSWFSRLFIEEMPHVGKLLTKMVELSDFLVTSVVKACYCKVLLLCK